MSGNWHDAIRKYQRADDEKSGKRIKEETDQAIRELDQFMNSQEGLTAIALLKASGKHIIFGEEDNSGSGAVVYFINGDGLQQSIESKGTWGDCAKEVPKKPKLSPISAQQAICAAVHYDTKKPSEILNWLRGQLNEIANSAPETPTA